MTEDERRVLERLQASALGMSTRDLARSTRLAATDVNRTLLSLQSSGLIRRSGTRWLTTTARFAGVGNVQPRSSKPQVESEARATRPATRLPRDQDALKDHRIELDEPHVASAPSRIDRKASRWATFRNLCEYYAECVRLDQRSTIHAKADEEFSSIVCLDGRLPDSLDLSDRTHASWNQWVRKATEAEYLFLGYPLQRYRWRDTAKGEVVDFVSPVFLVPCRHEMSGTELRLTAVGGIRINEGWLERRLGHVEQRKTFIELLTGGSQGDESEDVIDRSWSDYAQLLNHYYHDWCVEPLDPRRVASEPGLSALVRDGLYNRAAIVVPKKWRFTNRLHAELLSLANAVDDAALDKTALRYIFPHQSPPKRDAVAADLPDDAQGNSALAGASPISLNAEQQRALDAAATQGLTVVVGPPGTGKSRMVSAALLQQPLLGRNALFASRNHQALEAVVPTVRSVTAPWPLILRLARPWGAGVDDSLTQAIAYLVGGDRPAPGARLEQLRTMLIARVAEQRDAAGSLDRLIELRQAMADLSFDLENHLPQVAEAIRSSLKPNHGLEDPAALDLVAAAVRGPGPWKFSVAYLIEYLRHRLKRMNSLRAAQQIDLRFRRHCDPGGGLPSPPSEVSPKLAEFYAQCVQFWKPAAAANQAMLQLEKVRAELAGLPDVDAAGRSTLQTSHAVNKVAKQACEVLAQQAGAGITNETRRELADALAAIQNQSGLDDEGDRRRWERTMAKALPLVSAHFPIVATTNLSVGRDLALQPAVFDLLVVDEASQCDVASVVPLLFRSRRAMIVGDPMQLSQITGLSAATDKHLRRQFRVDTLELERFSYRTTSMFHLANTSESVAGRVSLRQHHRCHPSIARYCNETFYRGSWIVLTEHSGRPGLLWTDVPDDSEPVSGGGAVSPKQIEAVVDCLRQLDSEWPGSTVGVVTPFRRQADQLRDAAAQAIPKPTLDRWRFLVDTADGFQGDERDVVLLSLVGGGNLTDGSLRFLAGGPNRFNVAASRARRQLHVFGDAAWARGCGIPHIAKLIEACDDEATATTGNAGSRSDLVGAVWEPAFAAALREAGLPVHQQYPALGRYLDIALLREGLKLDVEVDGEAYHRSPGGGSVEEDIRRDQALIAAGWIVQRFWVHQLREDLAGCVEAVRRRFSEPSL